MRKIYTIAIVFYFVSFFSYSSDIDTIKLPFGLKFGMSELAFLNMDPGAKLQSVSDNRKVKIYSVSTSKVLGFDYTFVVINDDLGIINVIMNKHLNDKDENGKNARALYWLYNKVVFEKNPYLIKKEINYIYQDRSPSIGGFFSCLKVPTCGKIESTYTGKDGVSGDMISVTLKANTENSKDHNGELFVSYEENNFLK